MQSSVVLLIFSLVAIQCLIGGGAEGIFVMNIVRKSPPMSMLAQDTESSDVQSAPAVENVVAPEPVPAVSRPRFLQGQRSLMGAISPQPRRQICFCCRAYVCQYQRCPCSSKFFI
ncbi:hypothetical protein M3Y97_01091500 [Aphelenchoides bicaudatus]|nr:hypothetical protein M3Y97_01091500 [Aphelenchoides bicaudatus]